MRKYIGSFADGALEMLRTPACGRRMLGLVTAGFILLLATGVTSLWMSARTNDLLTRVEHTLQVRATLNDLAESIANAETHQRGFLLTGQSQFLGEYRQAHDRTLAALETIRLLVSDDPEQLVRIETLRPVVERRLEVQRPLAGPVRIEECGDLAIHDGALAVVEQLDLLRHDVQRVHLIMLRQQQRHRQSDVTSTGNRNLHGTLLLRCATRNSNYD